MKHSAEFKKFTNLVDQLMSVPHEEIKRREAEYKKQADANPNKRGPKKKKRKAIQPSADHGPTGNG
jgi:hypothetical protein